MGIIRYSGARFSLRKIAGVAGVGSVGWIPIGSSCKGGCYLRVPRFESPNHRAPNHQWKPLSWKAARAPKIKGFRESTKKYHVFHHMSHQVKHFFNGIFGDTNFKGIEMSQSKCSVSGSFRVIFATSMIRGGRVSDSKTSKAPSWNWHSIHEQFGLFLQPQPLQKDYRSVQTWRTQPPTPPKKYFTNIYSRQLRLFVFVPLEFDRNFSQVSHHVSSDICSLCVDATA